jgi:mannose-1-phosphate guanylyltransferase
LPVVLSFVEKPAPDVAADLLGAGAVWNTMVMVARAGTLRDLYARLLPDLTRFFTAALRLGDPSVRISWLLAIPRSRNWILSRDLLARASALSAYVWPESLGWSDLGTPERPGRVVSQGACIDLERRAVHCGIGLRKTNGRLRTPRGV